MDAQASTASHQAEKWSPSPDASDIVKNIHAMLHPRNIVLVGATDKVWSKLRTRDTVAVETPTALAISLRVTMVRLAGPNLCRA